MAKATIKTLTGGTITAETFSKHELHDRVRVELDGVPVGTFVVCNDKYEIEDPYGFFDVETRGNLSQALLDNAWMVHLTPV